MSIATKCVCGQTNGFCMQLPDCPHNKNRSLEALFIAEQCTDLERNQLKAFLFVLRNPNINWDAMNNLIKKYESIIINKS